MDTERFANPKWTERTPRLWARVFRGLAVDLAVFAVVAVLGETGIRMLLPGYSELLFTPQLTGGHPKAENSRGMRDREFPDQRPAGQTRILCLGNSTTFGAGVASDQTYPKQLEALLDDRAGGDRFFVINTGGEGNSLGRAVEFVAETGLRLDPALVVLGFSPSMLARAAVTKSSSDHGAAKRTQVSWSRLARSHLRRLALRLHGKLYGSYLYVFCDTNIRRRLYRWGVIRDRLDKPSGAVFAYAFDDPGVQIETVEASYAQFRGQLEVLKAALDENGVPLMLLGIPSRFNISNSPRDNERGFALDKIRVQPLDRIAEYCDQAGLPFVDLRQVLGDRRRGMLEHGRSWDDLYIPFDYTHLNRTGLHIAAEALLRRIEDCGYLHKAG